MSLALFPFFLLSFGHTMSVAEYFIVRNNPSVIAIFRDNAIDYEVWRIDIKYSTIPNRHLIYKYMYAIRVIYIHMYIKILTKRDEIYGKKSFTKLNRPKKYEVEYRWRMVRISQINFRLFVLRLNTLPSNLSPLLSHDVFRIKYRL